MCHTAAVVAVGAGSAAEAGIGAGIVAAAAAVDSAAKPPVAAAEAGYSLWRRRRHTDLMAEAVVAGMVAEPGIAAAAAGSVAVAACWLDWGSLRRLCRGWRLLAAVSCWPTSVFPAVEEFAGLEWIEAEVAAGVGIGAAFALLVWDLRAAAGVPAFAEFRRYSTMRHPKGLPADLAGRTANCFVGRACPPSRRGQRTERPVAAAAAVQE